MKKILIPFLLGGFIIVLSSFVTSPNQVQETPVIEDARSAFYYVLDNRFEGKSDAFLEIFNKTVTYPNEAKENCRMGLSKITFTIDKDGKMSEVKYNQKLGFGIDKSLDKFLKKIENKWKAFNRPTEFELTVGFRIKNGTINYRPDADLMVIARPIYQFSTGDASCGNTDELFKKVEKYMKKKKHSKAKPLVEELLRRFPDDVNIQKHASALK